MRSLITLFLLMFLFDGFAVCGQSKVIEVCDQCEYRSMNAAVQVASDGDTIRVKAGRYACENVTISKAIAVIGETGAILDGKYKSYLLRISANNVTIANLTIINSGRSYTKDYAAIFIHGASGFRIINNNIRESFFGILVERSKKGVLSGNHIAGNAKKEDDSGNGIHLWHCDSMSVEENEVVGMRDGIYFEFVNNSHVDHNHTHGNVRYGLHFMFSNNDIYTRNLFERNGAGVAVMFSKWIVMRENRFFGNWGTAAYGLLLKEIYDAEVRDNSFEENTQGIYIDGTTRIEYSGNTFRQNGWAIKVSGGCYANHFYKNNFVGNAFDLSYNARMNDNSFNGNFWSDYTGYDLNRDGLGDIPYRPVKLFSYIVNRTPETIVLLRSLFVDIINFSEKVSPVFTPDDLIDATPSMKIFP